MQTHRYAFPSRSKRSASFRYSSIRSIWKCGPSSQAMPSHVIPSRIARTASGVDRSLVGVLDPQDESAAVIAGVEAIEEGGPGAADVEIPRGAWCEARHDVRHGSSSIRGIGSGGRDGKWTPQRKASPA